MPLKDSKNIVVTALAFVLSGCGGLCPPWGNNAECEHSSPTPPTTVEMHPCDQLAEATGLPLVSAQIHVQDTGGEIVYDDSYPAWGGPPVGLGLSWGVAFPPGWHWTSTPNSYGLPAMLNGYEGGLVIDEFVSTATWRWLQVDNVASAQIDGGSAIVLPQGDGSFIVGADPSPGVHFWAFSGENVRARGWTSNESVLAGPSAGSTDTTNNGSKSWKPAHGLCEYQYDAADETGSDETGGGAGAPYTVAVGVDPCESIAASIGMQAIDVTRPWPDPSMAIEELTHASDVPNAASLIFDFDGVEWSVPGSAEPAWIGPFMSMAVVPTGYPADVYVGWIVVPTDQVEGWSLGWRYYVDGVNYFPQQPFAMEATIDGTDLAILAAAYPHVQPLVIDHFRIMNESGSMLAGRVFEYEGDMPDTWSAAQPPGVAPPSELEGFKRIYRDGYAWYPMGGTCAFTANVSS